MEDRLIEREERVVSLTLVEMSALLVDGEVDDRGEVVNDGEAVFETDPHVVLSCFLLHPALVVDRVGTFQTKAVVVLLSMSAWDLSVAQARLMGSQLCHVHNRLSLKSVNTILSYSALTNLYCPDRSHRIPCLRPSECACS